MTVAELIEKLRACDPAAAVEMCEMPFSGDARHRMTKLDFDDADGKATLQIAAESYSKPLADMCGDVLSRMDERMRRAFLRCLVDRFCVHCGKENYRESGHTCPDV